MTALDALPGDKSMVPMAQEAPVWGRGSPVIAAKMLSWWFHSFCVFYLSQTDCHQMEGYGFWTRAAGMIFHRVQRGDLGSLGWQLGDLGSLG